MVNSIAEVSGGRGVNCLLIVSPNYMHLRQLEEIAAIRPLPILCEKPLFTDPADAPRLAALRAAYPAPIWVAMEYRYMPPVARLAEEARSGHRRHQNAHHPRASLSLSREGRGLEPLQPQLRRHARREMLPFLRSDALHSQVDPVRVMASGGQSVTIWMRFMTASARTLGQCLCDRRFRFRRAGHAGTLHVCRGRALSGGDFRRRAEGQDRSACAGPGRFWPDHLGEPPVPQVVVSPREPKGPRLVEIPVDPQLLPPAITTVRPSISTSVSSARRWASSRLKSRWRTAGGLSPWAWRRSNRP